MWVSLIQSVGRSKSEHQCFPEKKFWIRTASYTAAWVFSLLIYPVAFRFARPQWLHEPVPWNESLCVYIMLVWISLVLFLWRTLSDIMVTEISINTEELEMLRPWASAQKEKATIRNRCGRQWEDGWKWRKKPRRRWLLLVDLRG